MDNHISSWIERAHSYPLSLVIRKRGDFLDPVCSVLSLIPKHQWKSITLDSGDTSIFMILKKLEFSNLETLESFSPKHLYYKLSLSDALRYAPKLKTLSLCVIYAVVTLDMLPFPWRQLTCLTITLWENGNIFVDLLRACVNLEELILDGDVGGSSLNDSITLNYLRKLHVHCMDNTFLTLKTPSIQDFANKEGGVKFCSYINGTYIKKHGLTLRIAPSDGRLVESFPYIRSLVELKLYDDDDIDGLTMHKILTSLVVNPEMEPSTVPLPRLEALEIICLANEKNQRMFMKVIDSRWWSDEEENARRFLASKRSVLMNVHTKLKMFCRDDVDVLRAQGMSIEYLAPFDGMDFYYSKVMSH